MRMEWDGGSSEMSEVEEEEEEKKRREVRIVRRESGKKGRFPFSNYFLGGGCACVRACCLSDGG